MPGQQRHTNDWLSTLPDTLPVEISVQALAADNDAAG